MELAIGDLSPSFFPLFVSETLGILLGEPWEVILEEFSNRSEFQHKLKHANSFGLSVPSLHTESVGEYTGGGGENGEVLGLRAEAAEGMQ